MRSPLDVVMTSFAHSRNMRYELDRRHAPEHIEIIELPRPADPRELFDFSGAHELIEAAYELCAPSLDLYLEGRVEVTPEDHNQHRNMRVRFATAKSRKLPTLASLHRHKTSV